LTDDAQWAKLILNKFGTSRIIDWFCIACTCLRLNYSKNQC